MDTVVANTLWYPRVTQNSCQIHRFGRCHGEPHSTPASREHAAARTLPRRVLHIPLCGHLSRYRSGAHPRSRRHSRTDGVHTPTHRSHRSGRSLLWRQPLIHIRHHHRSHADTGVPHERQVQGQHQHCCSGSHHSTHHLHHLRTQRRGTLTDATARVVQSDTLCSCTRTGPYGAQRIGRADDRHRAGWRHWHL